MLRATDALLHEGQVRARRSQRRIACRLIAVSFGSWLPPDYSGQLANPAHLQLLPQGGEMASVIVRRVTAGIGQLQVD